MTCTRAVAVVVLCGPLYAIGLPLILIRPLSFLGRPFLFAAVWLSDSLGATSDSDDLVRNLPQRGQRCRHGRAA